MTRIYYSEYGAAGDGVTNDFDAGGMNPKRLN